MKVSCQHHNSGPFTSGKEQPIYIAEGVEWAPQPVGKYREQKNLLPLTENEYWLPRSPRRNAYSHCDLIMPGHACVWRSNSQLERKMAVVTNFIWPSNVCLQVTDKCVSRVAESSGESRSEEFRTKLSSSKDNRQVTQLRNRRLETRITETIDKRLTCKAECFATSVENTWRSANAVSRVTEIRRIIKLRLDWCNTDGMVLYTTKNKHTMQKFNAYRLKHTQYDRRNVL
jgi:hypothetical protein